MVIRLLIGHKTRPRNRSARDCNRYIFSMKLESPPFNCRNKSSSIFTGVHSLTHFQSYRVHNWIHSTPPSLQGRERNCQDNRKAHLNGHIPFRQTFFIITVYLFKLHHANNGSPANSIRRNGWITSHFPPECHERSSRILFKLQQMVIWYLKLLLLLLLLLSPAQIVRPLLSIVLATIIRQTSYHTREKKLQIPSLQFLLLLSHTHQHRAY